MWNITPAVLPAYGLFVENRDHAHDIILGGKEREIKETEPGQITFCQKPPEPSTISLPVIKLRIYYKTLNFSTFGCLPSCSSTHSSFWIENIQRCFRDPRRARSLDQNIEKRSGTLPFLWYRVFNFGIALQSNCWLLSQFISFEFYVYLSLLPGYRNLY